MIKLPYYIIIPLHFLVMQTQARSHVQHPKDILIVSFISIGTGIDYKAKERLNLFVEDFQREHHLVIEVAIKNWGREGETDLTYDLKNLSKKQGKDFVGKIKEMFADNSRVKISYEHED